MNDTFDKVILCAVAQPGGGTFILRMGGEEQRWSLDAPQIVPACRAMETDSPVSSASITTEDAGIVTITSVGTFRKRGGGSAPWIARRYAARVSLGVTPRLSMAICLTAATRSAMSRTVKPSGKMIFSRSRGGGPVVVGGGAAASSSPPEIQAVAANAPSASCMCGANRLRARPTWRRPWGWRRAAGASGCGSTGSPS